MADDDRAVDAAPAPKPKPAATVPPAAPPKPKVYIVDEAVEKTVPVGTLATVTFYPRQIISTAHMLRLARHFHIALIEK